MPLIRLPLPAVPGGQDLALEAHGLVTRNAFDRALSELALGVIPPELIPRSLPLHGHDVFLLLSASHPSPPVSSLPLPHMPAPSTDPGAENPIPSGSQEEPLAPLALPQPLAPGGHAPELEIEGVEQSPHRQTRNEPAWSHTGREPHTLEMPPEGLDQLGPGVWWLLPTLEGVQRGHPRGQLAQGLAGVLHAVGAEVWFPRNADVEHPPAVDEGEQPLRVRGCRLLSLEQNLAASGDGVVRGSPSLALVGHEDPARRPAEPIDLDRLAEGGHRARLHAVDARRRPRHLPFLPHPRRRGRGAKVGHADARDGLEGLPPPALRLGHDAVGPPRPGELESPPPVLARESRSLQLPSS